jgi:hypothetical protein
MMQEIFVDFAFVVINGGVHGDDPVLIIIIIII